ncbi:MAG: CCA tRNA nucleotidyltransferase [Polyangiales bacterium]
MSTPTAAAAPPTVIAVPPKLVDLCAHLEARGFSAWLVGGAVRDSLLHRPVGDWDVATTARPEDVQRAFRKVIPTGIQHGTVTVLWRGAAVEVTTLRTEGAYRDGRRPEAVHFVEDIGLDLARRDFTINAMAWRPHEGVLVDPFGGRDDLTAGQVRAVGDALTRFREDGLRILRAARFVATLDFQLDTATAAAMTGALDVLAQVSGERIRVELWKLLAGRQPTRGLTLLWHGGALATLWPEVQGWSPHEAMWQRACEMVSVLPPEPCLRLAGLLWGLIAPFGPSWRAADAALSKRLDQASALLLRLKPSKQERQRVHSALSACSQVPMRGASSSTVGQSTTARSSATHPAAMTPAAVQACGTMTAHPVPELEALPQRQWVAAQGRAAARDAAAILRAAAGFTDAAAAWQAWHDAVEAICAATLPLSVGELRLSGGDLRRLLDVPAGPELGQLLRHLLQHVLAHPEAHTEAALLAAARRWLAAQGGA